MPLDLTLFNPFSETDNSWNSDVHIWLQSVVYYAESRFWVILNEISNKNEIGQRKWIMQIFLHKELVMHFIIFSA